jgi:hypothetical protein
MFRLMYFYPELRVRHKPRAFHGGGGHKKFTRCDNPFMHPLETMLEVISAIMQWAFILVAATSPIVLNVWAWMRLRRPPVPEIGAPWQRRVAYLSLAINFFAYVLPLAVLVRNSSLLDSGRPVQAGELFDGRLMQDILMVFVAVSIVLAAIGPKYVRIQLILSPLLPFFFWMSLPAGFH